MDDRGHARPLKVCVRACARARVWCAVVVCAICCVACCVAWVLVGLGGWAHMQQGTRGKEGGVGTPVGRGGLRW